MTIDDKSYALSNKNYVSIECQKTRIVLAHTFTNDMKHFIGWTHRYNGLYKNTAPFTISKSGQIYKHYEPSFSTKMLKAYELNMSCIVILLENEGWLIKDSDKNEFITWMGDIYKEPNMVVEKRWRGYNYWAPYTKEQLYSATELVKSLCVQFNIPLSVVAHNTKLENFSTYKGVFYKSNIEKHYTDLNPTWDFEIFKRKIETNEK